MAIGAKSAASFTWLHDRHGVNIFVSASYVGTGCRRAGPPPKAGPAQAAVDSATEAPESGWFLAYSSSLGRCVIGEIIPESCIHLCEEPPTYKTKYRVANWPAYNRALVRRGDVTVWVSSEAIAAWTASRSGRRGGQRRHSDLAIETALTLRLIYHLPLRQAEGFLHALFGIMRLDLSVPDYTTLSRRSQHLRRRLRSPVPPDEGLHLVLDSTGLSLVGAGEWAAAKHGGRGRRGWRKLHLGVDQLGAILVHTLTEATGDDATTALDLLTAVEGPLVRITADAASDTVAVYETATARGATVVIPPARTANVSGHGPRSPARDRTITVVKQLGRRRWKKTSGYHRQSRVENTFFRYTSIIGDGLRARSPTGQGSEVVLGCEILNRMTELGRPVSYRIGR